ncbi:hypothetical protein LTR08_001339 [Meristemomyces frigidus]|nr:hypothetical protein LTR08_001339 [Meristemomyces frigidus]
MPTDDPPPARDPSDASRNAQQPVPEKASRRSFFALPAPVKRMFDHFPLVTYAENELPARAPKGRQQCSLHVFTTDEDARQGRASFNPGCLKWQVYLKFNDIPFRAVPSNNHASPSGALPFLLPAATASESDEAVSSKRLRKWVASQKTAEKVPGHETEDVRYEAYASLLENRVRKAWLFQLYLSPANRSVVHRLYIAPCSSNLFIQLTIAHQLRAAAESEFVKSCSTNTLVEDDIMRDAESALEALATLLGEDDWFFGQGKPGLFDASVFAYTQLVLDEGMQWSENKLGELVRSHGSLVQHRERVGGLYF